MLRKSAFLLLSSAFGAGVVLSAVSHAAPASQPAKPKAASWQPPQKNATRAPAAARSQGAASGSRAYVVKSGDTPSSIARRHGMTVAQFMKLNGLTAKSVIKPGQRLKTSSAAKTEAPVVAKKTEPEQATRGTGGRYGHGASAPPAARQYKVKSGDTVHSIARHLGVSEQELMRHNGIKDAKKLKAGALLTMPGVAEPEAVGGAAALLAGSDLLPALPKGWRWHTVKSGESLSQIAARYGLGRSVVEEVNKLASGSPPHEGEHLKIPPADFAASVASTARAGGPGQAKPWSERGPEGILGYTVQKDDTYDYLSREFKTSESVIRQLNRFTANEPLIAGRRIVVPNTLFD